MEDFTKGLLMSSESRAPILLRRSDAGTSWLANGNAAFIWKLHCHWLISLWQHQIIVVRQTSDLTKMHSDDLITDNFAQAMTALLLGFVQNFYVVGRIFSWQVQNGFYKTWMMRLLFCVSETGPDPLLWLRHLWCNAKHRLDLTHWPLGDVDAFSN